MNLVMLIGNLATDPEIRHTASGKPVCSFRIALSRNNGSEADFVTVVAWERQAEICKEYLTCGRQVAVEGRLHQSVWETEDGKRSRIEVVAHRIELLARRKPEHVDSVEVAAAQADGASEFGVAAASPEADATESAELAFA